MNPMTAQQPRRERRDYQLDWPRAIHAFLRPSWTKPRVVAALSALRSLDATAKRYHRTDVLKPSAFSTSGYGRRDPHRRRQPSSEPTPY